MSRKNGESPREGENEKMLFCDFRGPGPAVYQLRTLTGAGDHCKTKPQAPSYSIGQRRKWKTTDTPGPAYNFHSSLTSRGNQKAPAFSVIGRPKAKGVVDESPGPGAYDLKPADSTPRLTIGLPTRSPISNDAPAPNAYRLKSGIGTRTVYEPTSPACLLRSRGFVGSTYYPAAKSGVPGPATYGSGDDRQIYTNRGGPYTIKSRLRYNDPLNKTKEGPGPGAYDPRLESCNGRRGASMGIRHSSYLMPFVTERDMIY